MKYRYEGREKRISLGVYPEVSLKAARDKCNDFRKLLKDGIDPAEVLAQEKHQQKATDDINSFQYVAKQWLAHKKHTYTEKHHNKIEGRLERDIYPSLGTKHINNITPQELLRVFRKIESRGAIELMHRIKSYCSMIFRYGVACGESDSDPTRDLTGALKPVVTQHYATITQPKKIGGLMRAIADYDGNDLT